MGNFAHQPGMTREAEADQKDAQLIACPHCRAEFVFRRSPDPRIDSCGFETYSFRCEQCGATLAGVIDPYDDALLFSD